MKKYINRIIPILLISIGAALFSYNILSFSHNTVTPRGYRSGAPSITTVYYYKKGYVYGATAGVFLFTLGITIRKGFQKKGNT